ncbi:hypothetical protein NT6N_25910 [Oceaniferula spumae]|uniref:Ice-binding protein C-terminal domain-containing protein n=1 Tax=Oceaniferula spumae TaxID=2979115 RepID=A0AAT9FNI4_9BACT
MKTHNKRAALATTLGLSVGLIASSQAATVLQSNDFGAGPDIGPALQQTTNSLGTGGSSDPSTGVITTGANNTSTYGFNSSGLVDVTSVAGATGFTVEWVVTGISQNVDAIQSNDMFFGVTGNASTSTTGVPNLFNNSGNAIGIKLDVINLQSSFFEVGGAQNAQMPAGLTTASMEDGFIISFTVNDDNTWSATSTGLETEINSSGTLAQTTYAGIASGLGAYTSVQGNSVIYTVDNVTITTVPEPSSAALLGFGGLALVLRRRK